MASFEKTSELAGTNASQLYQYHLQPGALGRLVPPWQQVSMDGPDLGISEGLVRRIRIGPPPFALPWDALHEDFIEDEQFVDSQLKGPFRHWRHTHSFAMGADDRTLLKDSIHFEFPLKLPLGFLLQGQLETGFDYRHRQTAADLRRINQYRSPVSLAKGPALRIGVTGSSGLVGRALCSFLGVAGHVVVPLKRGYSGSTSETPIWWPEPDTDSLEGLDAVIHLAGEPIAKLWTKSHLEKVYFSRVEGTKRLCRALAGLKDPPRVFLSASAIGLYETDLGVNLDEDGPIGSGFLAETCQDWESAAQPAKDAGMRVCHLRIGLILSSSGGYLQMQIPPTKMGMSTTIGSGRQMQSVIDLDDIVGAFYHLLMSEKLSGPFNGTAPHPVSQARFAAELAERLKRPNLMKMPAPVLKAVLGKQASMFLEGASVVPSRLLDSGFEFHYPTLEESLAHQLP